jgi:transcriptional regulator with XRE-family HTH domain
MPSRTPERLAEKLLRIRQELGLSQGELLRRFGLEDEIYRSYISAYEHGSRIPSLVVLLQYARVANVWVDVLIDDELELPKRLPADKKTR